MPKILGAGELVVGEREGDGVLLLKVGLLLFGGVEFLVIWWRGW